MKLQNGKNIFNIEQKTKNVKHKLCTISYYNLGYAQYSVCVICVLVFVMTGACLAIVIRN